MKKLSKLRQSSSRASSKRSSNSTNSKLMRNKIQRNKNSLGDLAKDFMKYVKKKKFEDSGNRVFNMTNLAEELNVSKRRIYDVTNVLEGIKIMLI